MNYYLDVLKKYAVFAGRARRAEYWYFVLFNFIITVVLEILAAASKSQILMGVYVIYALAMVIPSLAVAVRRLHDIGKSGWWIFISLIPIIGTIWFIVLLATGSKDAGNKYA